MKKHYVWLMASMCVILLALLIWLEVSADHLAPEIHFSGESLTWEQGEEEELLQGVSAVDNRDGDVTDSLIIEDIFLDEQEGTATVIYAAKDEQNNIGKASRLIAYEAGEPGQVQGSLEAEVIEPVRARGIYEQESEAETEPGNTEETGAQAEPEPGEETDAQAEPEPGEETDAGADTGTGNGNEAPVITLSRERVEIPAGNAFDAFAYVEGITDDKDAASELRGRLAVTGNVNSDVPGTYQVTFTVQDSEGARSEEMRLAVVVRGDSDETVPGDGEAGQ